MVGAGAPVAMVVANLLQQFTWPATGVTAHTKMSWAAGAASACRQWKCNCKRRDSGPDRHDAGNSPTHLNSQQLRGSIALANLRARAERSVAAVVKATEFHRGHWARTGVTTGRG
jgi:hypothetical protein